MRRLLFPLIIIDLLLAGFVCSDPLCGPASLKVICDHYGIQTNTYELIKLSSTTEYGTTMLGLVNAARAKGLKATGVKARLSEIAFPAICHQWSNHFVVVYEDDDPGMIRVNDSGKIGVIAREDFDYSGFAVVFGGADIAETSGPDLRADSYTWSAGRMYEGEIRDHVFALRNVGDAPIDIKGVTPSCSCITPLARDLKEIPAGGTAELAVFYDATGQAAGPQEERITILSNDPITPSIVLTVQGEIRLPFLETLPAYLDFGKVRVGQSVSRDLHVVEYEVVEVSGAQAKVEKRDGYSVVHVSVTPDRVGDWKRSLKIKSTHPKQPVAEVPMQAEVKPRADVSPEMVFLQPGKEVRVVVSDPVRKASCDIASAVVDGSVIVVSQNDKTPKGYSSGKVKIVTERETVEIPAYTIKE